MAEQRFADVTRLLEPRSVAVIGASDEPGNLGGTAVRYLRKFRYTGKVWPINPRRDTVAGLPCFPDVTATPGVADLAVIAVKAELVPGVVRSCAAAGIGYGVAWAGGFAEVGGDGVARQAELAAACRDTGFSLLGPNCLGLISTGPGLTATFASFLAEVDDLPPGPISMVSHSGGMGTQAQALAARMGIGFRHMVNSGNEVGITAADLISAFTDDPETTVIAAYLEGIGDGARLRIALDRARAAGTPVVVLMGGSAPASARAAGAHTAALVGGGRARRAVLAGHGVIQVDSLEELLDVVALLATTGKGSLPKGPGTAIVTFGGGAGVLSADQAAAAGLATPPLTPATERRLRDIVPPIASVGNPVDLTPEVYLKPQYRDRFADMLRTIADDAGIDTVLVQLGPMSAGVNEMIDGVLELRASTDKTVGVAWTMPPAGADERLRKEGVHVFDEPARAIRALGRLAERSAAPSWPVRASPAATFGWEEHVPRASVDTVVAEHDCHRLLAHAGLPVARGQLATTAPEVADALNAVGTPVAMKAISAEVLHRDAAGLVALGIADAAQALQVYGELTARAAAAGVVLDGVYVQRMVTGGREVLVSAFRDPVFGVMVSCGTGGTMTELVDDVALAPAPLDAAEAAQLLGSLRLVRAARRKGDVTGLDSLATFVAAFSELAVTAPWHRFVLEINPVKWIGDTVVAIDGLLTIEEP